MLSTIKPSRQDATPFRSLFWVGGASEWPRTCYIGIHSRLLSPNGLRLSTFPLFRSQASRHHAQLFILICSKAIQFLCARQVLYQWKDLHRTGRGGGNGTGSGYLEFLMCLTLQGPEKNFSSHGLSLCLIP